MNTPYKKDLGYLVTVDKEPRLIEDDVIVGESFLGIECTFFGSTIGSKEDNTFVDVITEERFPILPINEDGSIILDENINPEQLYVYNIESITNLRSLGTKENGLPTLKEDVKDFLVAMSNFCHTGNVNFLTFRWVMNQLTDDNRPHYTDPVVQKELAKRRLEPNLQLQKKLKI